MNMEFEDNFSVKPEMIKIEPSLYTLQQVRSPQHFADVKMLDFVQVENNGTIANLEDIQVKSEFSDVEPYDIEHHEHANVKVEPIITDEFQIKEECSSTPIISQFVNCNTKLNYKKLLANKVNRSSKKKCSKCQFRTVNKEVMQNHVRDVHLKCSVCGYIAQDMRSLEKHIMVHTGERPFKCEQCSYSSIQKVHLTAHLKMHTGEKPYRCCECDFSTTWKSSLQVHMKAHSGEKPYKCTECEYSTVRKSDLRKHIMLHNNEKPFQCIMCSYKASRNYHIKIHMRTHNK